MSKLPDLTPEQKLALRVIYNTEDRCTYPSVRDALEAEFGRDVRYYRAQQIVRSLMAWGLVRPVNRGGGRGSYRRFTYTDDGAAVLHPNTRTQRSGQRSNDSTESK
jgi:hypothetical protein